MLENSNRKLYYGRSTITDGTIYNNRPDIIVLYKTVKEAYLRDAAILNSHTLLTTITDKLQK